jgi:hypothetical protein
MPRLHPGVFLLILSLCAALHQPAMGQQPDAPSQRPKLTAEQVVENLVQMNQERAHALRAYEATRVYRLEYRGFPGARDAEMVVNIKYRSPSTKEFTVVSSSGSKLLINRVFKKLLESEQEAFESRKHTAINAENYDFTLAGFEESPSGSFYVLGVKPKTKNKFLFEGRIWVDAQAFAVARIEAQPSKNPSFWIKDTKIEEVNMKVNDFWLPSHNHSVTSVRLGGHADFTIEYKDYQITDATPLDKLRSLAQTSK